MAHDAFISYSHNDKPVADAVVAGLEHKGVRCWIAPRDVTPGTSWGDAIVSAIESSRIMVVILSGNSNRSRQVVREVERAVANGVIIIPFRIEKIDPTGAMAYFLSTEHWLDALTPPLEDHIEKLGSTVQLFLAGGGAPVAEGYSRQAEGARVMGAPPGAVVRRRRPAALVAALLAIVAVAVLGIVLIPRLLGEAPASSPAPPAVAEAPASPTLPPATATPTETVPPPTPTPVPPPEFSVIGEYRTSGSANGLFVAGSMLTLANGLNGLLRIDVSDPAGPIPGDTYPVGDLPAQDVFTDGETAYVIVGDHSRSLVIMELGIAGASTTVPPKRLSVGGSSSLVNVTVAGGLAHLTGHNYWGILDVSDPMQPEDIWHWEPPSNSGMSCNAVVEGSIAYISGGWAGLFIFDITDPRAPELLGQFETNAWIVTMEVIGRVLYLTLGEGGLLTLDVSDPARPLLLGRLRLPGFSNYLSADGDTLYVVYIVTGGNVAQEAGVVAVDVRDPAAPAIVATYDRLDMGTAVQAVDDVVFVTDQTRGVIILGLEAGE